jgi:hypothetical protein
MFTTSSGRKGRSISNTFKAIKARSSSGTISESNRDLESGQDLHPETFIQDDQDLTDSLEVWFPGCHGGELPISNQLNTLFR